MEAVTSTELTGYVFWQIQNGFYIVWVVLNKALYSPLLQRIFVFCLWNMYIVSETLLAGYFMYIATGPVIQIHTVTNSPILVILVLKLGYCLLGKGVCLTTGQIGEKI